VEQRLRAWIIPLSNCRLSTIDLVDHEIVALEIQPCFEQLQAFEQFLRFDPLSRLDLYDRKIVQTQEFAVGGPDALEYSHRLPQQPFALLHTGNTSS